MLRFQALRIKGLDCPNYWTGGGVPLEIEGLRFVSASCGGKAGSDLTSATQIDPRSPTLPPRMFSGMGLSHNFWTGRFCLLQTQAKGVAL